MVGAPRRLHDRLVLPPARRGIDLLPAPPVREISQDYRRWAFESAALDLALRQAGTTLARGARPRARSRRLRRLDAPRRATDAGPGRPIACDATRTCSSSSTRRTPGPRADRRAGRDRRGRLARLQGPLHAAPRSTSTPTPTSTAPGRELPRRLDRGPGSERPRGDDVLKPHRDRITWDAPIHSVDDIDAMPFAPKMINIKPSRFGR